jgi:hypothetical protein
MKRLFIVLIFLAITGCTTISNDQSACTTDCNIGSSGYVGVGGDINNDQSACTDDCNIGTSYAPTRTYYWSSNITYHPYHPVYRRGPMVIYHY